MPQDIDRDGVGRLVASGAQVVEVLPEPEYRAAHLPGALHLPLKTMDATLAHEVLDTERPVIAYCNDFM